MMQMLKTALATAPEGSGTSTPDAKHPTVADLNSALVRYHRESLTGRFHTGRYLLQYRTWGKGRPVILVHGMCDTNISFCMVATHLVDAGYQVIGYELANGLDDDAVLGKYRHEDFAHDLIAFADHLGIQHIDVMGSSFGSTVTLRALALYPQRFHRAVLQGGFARRPLIRIERGLARTGRYWPWRMGDLPIRDLVMRKLEKAQFEGCPDEVFQFLIECSGLTPIRAACRRALILDTMDMRPLLPSITAPVLMIGGDRDLIVPRQYEAEVEAGVPHVRRVEFSPCGHYPQYTMPAPMAREMMAWYES